MAYPETRHPPQQERLGGGRRRVLRRSEIVGPGRSKVQHVVAGAEDGGEVRVHAPDARGVDVLAQFRCGVKPRVRRLVEAAEGSSACADSAAGSAVKGRVGRPDGREGGINFTGVGEDGPGRRMHGGWREEEEQNRPVLLLLGLRPR